MAHMPAGQLASQIQTVRACFIASILVFIVTAIVPTAMAVPVSDGVTASDKEYSGLLFRTEAAGKFLPAPLIATRVDIHVTGPIARTRVRQYYQNPTSEWLEGIYVFPLPDKSAVDTMNMRIGEREIVGVIEERKKAKQMYEKAKAAGKRAALLESERPNIFTTSVANIGPDEGIMIEIEYQEVLPFDNGEFRLRFPMVVGHRYNPAITDVTHDSGTGDGYTANIFQRYRVADADRITPPVLHPDAGQINPLDVTVMLEGGAKLKGIKSHHHAVEMREQENGRLDISLATGPVPADRDFELTWSPLGAATQPWFFSEYAGDSGFGLIMISPPDKVLEADYRPREVVFIVDTSGSMAGTSIKQAKAALIYAIQQLSPDDRFNIIEFNSVHSSMWWNSRDAILENINEAVSFVSSLEADGGTVMAPAIDAALDGKSDLDRLRHVIFLTDGGVGNEAALFDLIDKRIGDSRLFTVGIGSAPNSHFMTVAAEMGRGTFTYIGAPDQVEARMTELWQKLLSPVLTHIQVVGNGGKAIELWPSPLPDLFVGKPLTFVLRWQGSMESVVIKGQVAGGIWEQEMRLGDSNPGTGISRLWAREKIHGLESSAYRNVDDGDVNSQVLETALKYGLVTRQTSLVAIELDDARPSDKALRTSRMPVNLPAGWEYESVFGTRLDSNVQSSMPWRKGSVDAARRRIVGAAVGLKLGSAPLEEAKRSDQTARKLTLPGTATDAPLWQLIGLMLLIASLMVHLAGRRKRLVS